MFIRDRKDNNLTKNIVMTAPVTMNSTLDNTGILGPLLKFTFKINILELRYNSLYYFVDNKKITSNYYLFPQLSCFIFIICLAILIFVCFLFKRMFLNFHSFLLSRSPHIVIFVVFNRDLIFDS